MKPFPMFIISLSFHFLSLTLILSSSSIYSLLHLHEALMNLHFSALFSLLCSFAFPEKEKKMSDIFGEDTHITVPITYDKYCSMFPECEWGSDCKGQHAFSGKKRKLFFEVGNNSKEKVSAEETVESPWNLDPEDDDGEEVRKPPSKKSPDVRELGKKEGKLLCLEKGKHVVEDRESVASC